MEKKLHKLVSFGSDLSEEKDGKTRKTLSSFVLTNPENSLPTTTDELGDYIIVTRAIVQAHMKLIECLKQLEVAIEVYEHRLRDAQELSHLVLLAEAKMGDFIISTPDYHSSGRGTMKRKQLPASIDKKKSHYAQQLAKNRDFIEMVRIEALEKDSISTRQRVLNLIIEKKRKEKQESYQKLGPPEGMYRVIYADPPWDYGEAGKPLAPKYGDVRKHYKTMTLSELCEYPVADLALDNAVLFLWTTAPMLKKAMTVLDAWGFEYKTCAVWDKAAHNWGYYLSIQHEILLIATMGSCTPYGQLHSSVIRVKRSKRHSEKPEEVRSMIDDMYPPPKKGIDRIELFSRTRNITGWNTWGNETEESS